MDLIKIDAGGLKAAEAAFKASVFCSP